MINGRATWAASGVVLAVVVFGSGFYTGKKGEWTEAGMQQERVETIEANLHEVQQMVQTLRAKEAVHDSAMERIEHDVDILVTDVKELLRIAGSHTHNP